MTRQLINALIYFFLMFLLRSLLNVVASPTDNLQL